MFIILLVFIRNEVVDMITDVVAVSYGVGFVAFVVAVVCVVLFVIAAALLLSCRLVAFVVDVDYCVVVVVDCCGWCCFVLLGVCVCVCNRS